jgi:hypothetical protein
MNEGDGTAAKERKEPKKKDRKIHSYPPLVGPDLLIPVR